MKKRENVLLSKQGMTLTEMLVALALLMLIILTFLPLFTSTYRNIYTAGVKTQQTVEKASLMERLIAAKGSNAAGYETSVTGVPLTLTAGGTTVSFGTGSGDIDTVSGTVIATGTSGDQYTTFYTADTHSRMICFPASLTDDFLTTDITLVPKGFDFAQEAKNKDASTSGYHFEVHYTPSDVTAEQKANPMLLPKVSTELYDITYVKDSDYYVAVFTLKGGNNIISSENSPIVITYGQGTSGASYYAEIELGAPEIILVGDKASDGSYYYYVTSGVDSDGNMDLIAKKMTGTSALTSDMNDVEWVSEGMGDNGSGGANEYGYYVMGGDAGQVRRFWRNENTGNYYWGGDNLTNYNRYAYLDYDGTAKDGSYEILDPQLTTQAQFKSIFRSGQSDVVTVNGNKVNELFKSEKISLFAYKALTSNYYTANVTESEYNKYFTTLSGAVKIKNWLGTTYEYYGPDSNSSEDESLNQIGWLTGGATKASKLNADGYKEATDYQYSDDTSLITITSVGAISFGNSSKYYESQDSTALNSNVYPTQSYTLYCGYIPAVIDAWGWKTSTTGWKDYIHVGTYGVAYSSTTDSWYPTGKFGDIYTTSTSLSSDVFPDLSYRTLLNYCDTNTSDRNTLYPYPTKNSTTYYYKAGETTNGITASGIALPAQGNDYYITNGKEVDVTIGYLSNPFAVTLSDPDVPTIEGLTGSDYYFEKFNSVSGKFDHSFFSGGLRDNVTFLDVKSFHDDIYDNDLSFAAGYTLSYILSDYSYATRVNQVYNTGIVYIRATGDSNADNDTLASDTTGDLSSGKGWSLQKETNVFHQFFGTDQYYGNDAGLLSKDGTLAVLGWDTSYHRAYFNISSDSNRAPQSSYSPTRTYGSTYGTNCHPLAYTECNTINRGLTWDEYTQIMWGTDNGTVLSWNIDYANPADSKITSVLKEFESYTWADRIGSSSPLKNDSNAKQFYDYTSVNDGTSSNYGFVSVLSSIKDIAYGDNNWVAVGNQSGKAPSDYCASDKCYTGSGGAASYINVKYCYDDENKKFAWKAVKVADENNVNFISVTYSNGVWYAMGYIDKDGDNEKDSDESCVIYYSRDPANEWSKAKTRTSGGTYTDSTTALYYASNGDCKEIEVKGLNSMASRN